MTTPLTITLRSGITVLAKLYKGAPYAITYANRTQAENAAKKTGGQVFKGLGRPFLVRLDGQI